METISINLLIKHAPSAIAIVDTKLNYINYSDQWLKNFTSNKIDIGGQHLLDASIELPIPLIETLASCFQGNEDINEGEKFILPSGNVKWLKWKISPLKKKDGTVSRLLIYLEDITKDRREIELLQKAKSVARVGGWEVDLIKNTIYWTKTTRQIHEVDESFLPDLGQGINFYKKGIHREKITELVSAAIEQGKPWDTELIIVTAKGNEVWVRAKGETEMVNGKCVRIFGTFQDINERKKSELKYNKVSERLKIATNTATIGIWEYDIKNNALVWDNSMYKLYGIDKSEFSGAFDAWESRVHPEDKELGKSAIEMAISGVKDFNTEFRIILPNGKIKNIKAIAETERDTEGKATKMIGANWDISELRKAELKLEKYEESFLDTFENSATGMALVALDGSLIRVNNSLCTSLGYTEKEFLGLSFQDITHPKDLNTDLELLNDVINNKRESYQLEKRYFHKKGHLVYVILTVTVVRKINGEISHFVSQVLDITKRIEAENKMQSLVEVTKSQNESLMNFAHIVSHNLRSHSTNLNMLTSFLAQEEDEKERDNLNGMMTNAAESLSETIAHLNEVVQVKTGTLENLKRVSILSTLIRIQKSIGGLFEKQDATLDIEVSKLHFVHAVPAYLDSIFLNILTNALKYRSPDRIPAIKIKSVLKKDKVLISFKDNGQGIDLNRHGDKIFGMYKTFHKHKDSKGIGLFITKNQIEAMNGSIGIESKVNEGTTIHIELKQA